MTHDDPCLLPDDWQRQMVEMIRGAKPLDGSWFAGGPVLSPDDQIEVYRNQYRLRLYDAVVEEVPGLFQLLGDQAEATLRAYIADHPSTSWTLNDVALHLADWLEARDAPVAHVEMARLDRAVQRGFTAAPGTPITADQLATMPPLRLQPHVTLLRNTTNVHRIRSAILQDEEPPGLQARDTVLVIFRRGVRMRHWEIDRGAFEVLDRIDQGVPVVEALNQLVADGLVTADELQASVAGWFQDFVERGLISGR